ncbi:MAG: DUF2306 domain-containing protein [Novosphingobium sp.]
MSVSTLGSAKRSLPFQAVRWIVLSAIAGFVTTVVAKGLMQTFDQDDFPEALLVKVEALPVIFPVHMFTGALALILIPLALVLRPWPKWHRAAGRIAAVDVLVAGISAFPVAWTEPVTVWSGAGFIAQAAVWLTFLALGIRHIRAGRVAEHRACMLLMTATASGAIFFRIYLASWALLAPGRHFAAFYSADAWAAWLLPVLGTALAIKKRPIIKQAGGWRTIPR